MKHTTLSTAERVADQTRIRRALLANGYSPFPCNGKTEQINDWPNIKATEALIDEWSGQLKWKSTAVHVGHNGLVGIDVDIDDAEVLADFVERIPDELWSRLQHAPVRYGGGVKEMWLARMAEAPAHYASKSGKWGVPDADDDTDHKVEVWLRHAKLLALYGARDAETEYRWRDGRGPHSVPVDALPEITMADVAALLEAAVGAMQARGWDRLDVEAPEGHGEKVYDLTADMEFVLQDGEVVSLAGLTDLCHASESVRLFSWLPGKRRRGDRCLARVNEFDGLVQVFDFDTQVLHRPVGAEGAYRRQVSEGLDDTLARLGQKLKPLLDGLRARAEAGDEHAAAVLAVAEANPETEADPLLFKPASEFEGVEVAPRRWLVEGLIPMNTVTLLSGDGGTGKSLLALQLAVAAGAAGGWLGRRIEEPGPALFLSAEDDDEEIHRRIRDVSAAASIPWARMSDVHLLSLAGKDALLATLAQGGKLEATALFKALDQAMTRAAPVLLVLDTLADLFPGNENDRAQARQFVGMLRGLAIRHHCAVVLLSHPSLSGLNSGTGTSGSTGWNNSVRSRLYLSRVTVKEDNAIIEADPDKRVLRGMKSNYARLGEEISLTWKAGVFVADEAPRGGANKELEEHRARQTFLRLLDQFKEQGRYVRSARVAGYAPKEFAASGLAAGFTKAKLEVAMQQLFASGEIVETRGGDGPPSRQTTRIVRVS